MFLKTFESHMIFFWSHLLKFRKINDACTWIRLNFNMQILSEAYFIINHNRNVSKTYPNPPKARRELGVKFYWAKPKAKNVHTLILWSKHKMKIVFRKKNTLETRLSSTQPRLERRDARIWSKKTGVSKTCPTAILGKTRNRWNQTKNGKNKLEMI